jgi:hypothetical protein
VGPRIGLDILVNRKICASAGFQFPNLTTPEVSRLLSRLRTLSNTEHDGPLLEKHWSGRRIVVAEIGQIRIECLL